MTAAAAPRALDERLVDLALDILADDGLEGLTLRRLAREAGVSHGAPLRHFRSFAALRSEIAARGFATLSRAVDEASAALAPGQGALARLTAAGRAYVRTAVANPSLFSLMFRTEDLDLQHPAFVREAGGAFEHLVRLVRAAQDAGWHPERETQLLAGSVWAAAQGFASLWAQGSYQVTVPNVSFEDALATTLDLVLGTGTGGST